MKKVLALILALAMALSLVACGSKDTADDKPSGTEVVDNSDANVKDDPNDTPSVTTDRPLNFAVSGDTGTLYPFAVSGSFVSLVYAFYEPLWDYDADGNMRMILAKEWEAVSDTQYKLTIRDDVKFANGNPLTAEDVYFSMELCANDPRFYLNVKVIDMEKTKVTGDYTMDVYYTTYDCTQEGSFSSLHIVDKESFDQETLSKTPNGTGPYILEDYVINSHVKCVANPNYWGEAPLISKLNFKIINEESQIVNAIETGDIDICSGVPLQEADYIETLGWTVSPAWGGYANVACYSFRDALADAEARTAVSMAINREAIAQVMYNGLSTVPSLPTSEHTFDYEERLSNMSEVYSVGYDVEKAKAHAEAAGLVGKTLEIITNGMESYNNAAAIIQENLNAIGVNSTIRSLDPATYFSVVMDESNFDIALFYFSAPSMLGVDIQTNYADFVPLGWKGDLRDQYGVISKEAVHTFDAQKRADLYYESAKIFAEVNPWYALCEAVAARAQSNDLGGVSYCKGGNIYYNFIYFK